MPSPSVNGSVSHPARDIDPLVALGATHAWAVSEAEAQAIVANRAAYYNITLV